MKKKNKRKTTIKYRTELNRADRTKLKRIEIEKKEEKAKAASLSLKFTVTINNTTEIEYIPMYVPI